MARGKSWQGQSLTKAGVGCGSRTKGTEATDMKESHSRKLYESDFGDRDEVVRTRFRSRAILTFCHLAHCVDKGSFTTDKEPRGRAKLME